MNYYNQLKEKLAEIDDLEKAACVLDWDQNTSMPKESIGGRANQTATLRKVAHEKFTDDKIGELINKAESEVENLDKDSTEQRLVKISKRDWDKAKKLPSDFVNKMSIVTSIATNEYTKAKEKKDYSIFLPHLKKIVDLNKQKADYLGWDQHPYDALIDNFEPGMTTNQIESLFSELKKELIPLVKQVVNKQNIAVDNIFVSYKNYDEKKQLEISEHLLDLIGFNFNQGRQDKSIHPFTINLSSDDVRLTIRLDKNRLREAIFIPLHEGGHGIYEQNLHPDLTRSPLATGASYAIHESQSRLWENLVGRSHEFLNFYYPYIQNKFPKHLKDIDSEEFYLAANKVESSFVRTEADEVTYNFHIFIRFEIERNLLENKIKPEDLPEIWNIKMKEYLGIIPQNDTLGVLQDIHWAYGELGYFPTYTLGNIISVQFFEQAKKEMPDLMEKIRQGDLLALKKWLNEKIHQHGRKFDPEEIVEKVTGQKITTEPYLDYIKNKYNKIYHLD